MFNSICIQHLIRSFFGSYIGRNEALGRVADAGDLDLIVIGPMPSTTAPPGAVTYPKPTAAPRYGRTFRSG